jgi:hypothetical protein
MRFQPSRRLILFCAVVLTLVVAPLAFFVFSAVREVVTPPVTGTRFLSYDGLFPEGACANSPSAKGGQVLVCDLSFHIDSRFAIVDRDSRATAWCIQQLDQAHFLVQSPRTIGPLVIGTFPIVPPDWGECTTMVPRRAGLYVQIFLQH